jgi:peptidoglycan/xylan/chitin deacetylase (PgdA/CDA1 family)
MTAETALLSRTASSWAPPRLKRARPVAPAAIAPPGPVISFTFDHAPRSALAGAEILERVGARGGFYLSTSLMGKRNPTLGDMIRPEDIAFLVRRGHEIGAQTHTQLDCVHASPEVVQADVTANFTFLRAAGAGAQPKSLAYPSGEASTAVRHWAAQRFVISRGAQAGVNTRIADRAMLRATLITSQDADRDRARRLIADCVKAKGWLIFYTHDVRSAPSTQGISLRHMMELVQIARGAGVTILPPLAAAELCGITAAAQEPQLKRAAFGI